MSVKGKVAFYSHDTVGLGHLRRCLKMAAAITDCLGVQDAELSRKATARFRSRLGLSRSAPQTPSVSIEVSSGPP